MATFSEGFTHRCVRLLQTVVQMLSWWLSGKESVVKNPGDLGFDPWVDKIAWRRVWQPTPVSLPGEFHGQSSLVGSSPWGYRVGQDGACTMSKQLTA